MEEYKAIVRAILMSLGGSCSKTTFYMEFNEQGLNLTEILQNENTNFEGFLKKMSDVCCFSRTPEGIMIHKKSSEESSHMDKLTKSQNARKKARKTIRRFPVSSDPKQAFMYRSVNNRIANHKLQQTYNLRPRPVAKVQPLSKPPTYHPKPPVIPKIEKLVVSQEVKDKVLAEFKPIIEDILIQAGGKCAESTLDNELYRRMKTPLDKVSKMYGSENTFELIKEIKTIRLIKEEGQNEPFVQVHPSLMPKLVKENDQPVVKVEIENQENIPPAEICDVQNVSSRNPFKHELIAKRSQIFLKRNNQIFYAALDDLSKNEKLEKPVKKVQKKIPYPSMTRLQSKMFSVSVKEVHSPSQFQLRLDDEFLKLFRDMKEHYKLNKCEPLESVEIGDCVAVLHKEDWFRGEVILKSREGILVKLVDTNVVSKTIHLKDLYPLAEDFITIGRKSLQCTLHGVRQFPEGKLWSLKGIMEFKKLVEIDEFHLLAKFKGVTQNNDIPDIFEVDLIVEDKVYGTRNVADQLITNGVASLKL